MPRHQPETPIRNFTYGVSDISLAQLVDDVQQAVIAADLEGNITHWNAYAEELYGWGRHEVLGRRVTMLAAWMETGATCAGTFTNKCRDGNEIQVFAIVAPIMRQGKLVGTFGVSIPVAVEPRIATLSARELEVLRLTAAAKKNNEVAKALGLSRRTIESHLGSIYSKLKISSRGELILFAARNGILPHEP